MIESLLNAYEEGLVLLWKQKNKTHLLLYGFKRLLVDLLQILMFTTFNSLNETMTKSALGWKINLFTDEIEILF